MYNLSAGNVGSDSAGIFFPRLIIVGNDDNGLSIKIGIIFRQPVGIRTAVESGCSAACRIYSVGTFFSFNEEHSLSFQNIGEVIGNSLHSLNSFDAVRLFKIEALTSIGIIGTDSPIEESPLSIYIFVGLFVNLYLRRILLFHNQIVHT